MPEKRNELNETKKVATPNLSPREQFLERKVNEYKEILEGDPILTSRIQSLIASHKSEVNQPIFIDAAKPSSFRRNNAGDEIKDRVSGEKIPFRWGADTITVKSASGRAIVQWIEDIEDIQKSIILTNEYIPGISIDQLPNIDLRTKNLDKATKAFNSYKDMLGKAGALIKEIKKLGFTATDLNPPSKEEVSA